MTDNEIIRALECCVKATKHSECSEYGCPALVEGTCLYEIRSDFPEYDEDVFKEQMIDLLGVINRQKAEIERLQKHNTETARKHYQDGKTDAIKEFMEIIVSDYPEMEYYLDNLVKELTEEQT